MANPEPEDKASTSGIRSQRGCLGAEIRQAQVNVGDRIKNGREGAMPAFGQMFSDPDIDAIINYIHELKPEGQG